MSEVSRETAVVAMRAGRRMNQASTTTIMVLRISATLSILTSAAFALRPRPPQAADSATEAHRRRLQVLFSLHFS